MSRLIAIFTASFLASCLTSTPASAEGIELTPGTRAMTVQIQNRNIDAYEKADGVVVNVVIESSTPVESTVTLQRVRLLAVGTNSKQQFNATVEVTPMQSAILKMSLDQSETRIVLRKSKKQKP